ncbi:O-antigen ligase [Mangrovimonas sp. ST2L15]|uniref:O-antigen ligase family protein n=1 Tax=Mangrovimonas sp. ST2L15 TaxID=1645916 RepID=UPI0006B6659A|nr:O-antigen ligase family protein [Mangrovimonas sp. ST2L15]
MILKTPKSNIIFSFYVIITYLIGLFPILTFGMRSILTISWVFFGLLNIDFKKKYENNLNKKYLLYLLFSILPFVCLCLTLLYSENLEVGVRRLTQILPFVIFPIIFYLNKERIEKRMINRILWGFSISVLILVFYQIICVLFNLDILLADLTKEEIISNRLGDKLIIDQNTVSVIKTRRFRSFLLRLVDTHPTYQGLWGVFSIFFLVKQGLILIRSKKNIGFCVLIASGVLLFWLFIISSRMPVISLVIAGFYSAVVLKRVQIKKQLLFIATTIFLLTIGYFSVTPFKVRVDEVINYKFEMPTENEKSYNHSSVNVRNGIYTCALSIVKDNLLFGVGVGDSQDELNTCYNNKIGAKIYTWHNYNTHNQFLFFIVASGIIGLLIFLILIFQHWRIAIENVNQIHLYFISIIILVSLTENILSRSDGVMFFAFFSSLFLFNVKRFNDNS